MREVLQVGKDAMFCISLPGALISAYTLYTKQSLASVIAAIIFFALVMARIIYICKFKVSCEIFHLRNASYRGTYIIDCISSRFVYNSDSTVSYTCTLTYTPQVYCLLGVVQKYHKFEYTGPVHDFIKLDGDDHFIGNTWEIDEWIYYIIMRKKPLSLNQQDTITYHATLKNPKPTIATQVAYDLVKRIELYAEASDKLVFKNPQYIIQHGHDSIHACYTKQIKRDAGTQRYLQYEIKYPLQGYRYTLIWNLDKRD